jgi:hypothetical protein
MNLSAPTLLKKEHVSIVLALLTSPSSNSCFAYTTLDAN